MSAHPALKEDILELLDGAVCTKHPPDWDESTMADNIIATCEQYMKWKQ